MNTSKASNSFQGFDLGQPKFNSNWRHSNLTSSSHRTGIERGVNMFRDALPKWIVPSSVPTGIYIGLGAEQNYTMMSHAKPIYAILYDYDPNVVAVHYLHRAAFLSSATIAEYIEFFSLESLTNSLAILREQYKNEPAILEATSETINNKYHRSGIQTTLILMKMGNESATNGIYEDTYVQNEEYFKFLRTMFLENRVRITMGNLYDSNFLQKIGNLAKHLKTKIVVCYISNAGDYDSDAFIRTKKEYCKLPIFEDSVLFLTTQSGRLIRSQSWSRMTVGSDAWIYIAVLINSI